jgi:dihydropyrimidine dehydrogenase (NAD+) subunit PreT
MPISKGKLSTVAYNTNFSDIHPPYATIDAALVDANKCLFCYDAPCTKLCPTSIDVPKFIKQIASTNVKGAAKTILESNILGAGCSKVCPVEKLCEGSCVYNLMQEQPIPIAKLQRYATEQALQNSWQFFTKGESIGKKVAVIGAGPAGLSCAHELSKAGVEVTLYEREPLAGGLMTYGIAAYKVTPEFCQQEVDYILGIGGITLKTNASLGDTIHLKELQQQYDAIFLALGVGNTKKLNVPGESLNGVVDAIHFIHDIRNKGYNETLVGDEVVVIGMGMTAIDAATQAKRLGAKKVSIAYRRTENEKPCTQAELDIALLDGCEMYWLAAPHKILGQSQVEGIMLEHMELGDPDQSGRRSPMPTGKTFTINSDMVIKAIGQTPFEALINKYNIANEKGKIIVNNIGATNIEKLFAGGDCVNGGKEVVDAVQAGKNGAKGILHYFNITL